MRMHNIVVARGIVRVFRMGRALVAIAGLAAALPAGLGAQTVRGQVTDGATGAPIPGVVLLLVDSAERAPRRAMSDETGSYAILAPGAGTYRIRAMRIGFRPTTSQPIEVLLGLNDVAPIRLAGIPVILDTVRVASRDVCGGQRDEGFATIWDQARTALSAAQLTAATRGLTARVVSYDRTLDPRSGQVQEQSAEVSSGFVTQPWRAASPAQLRRDGYVVRDDAGWVTYHAPGLVALASDEFIEDHCFRVNRAREGQIAIEFGPTRDRREIADIRGTIWLDAATSELRRMEYRYVNVSSAEENQAGGAVDFARLRDGGWAIARWNIRMPVLEQVVMQGRPTLRVSEIKVAGGDLALATRGTDTLWSRAAVAIAGTVVDSATGSAIVGARIALRGTGLETRSGDGGGFRLNDVLPGEYTLEVATAALDSVGAKQETPILVSEAAQDVQLRVGRPRPRFSTFAGVVVVDSTQQPIVEAEVTLPDLGRTTYTDSSGAFKVEDLPPGEHRVVVRRLGFGPLEAQLAFAPNETLDRRILLQSVGTLDTVSVVARSLIPSFDEHRAQMLGTFFTRADLEKQSGRRMSAVLSQVRGLRIQQGGSKAHVATRRRATARFRRLENPATGEAVVQAEEGFCYAAIYVNGSRVFEPDDDNAMVTVPPFDVNSIPVDQIEAIEYYATQASVPMRYSRGNLDCGVLVIHTRRLAPETREKP